MEQDQSSLKLVQAGLEEASALLQRFLEADGAEAIVRVGKTLASAIEGGATIYTCGNGGSMTDAMHLAEELTGRFRKDRRALPAVAIADPSHITCVGNDYGFSSIFSRYLDAHGKRGDVLVAFSTSGNSENIIMAAQAAKRLKMKVLALTGKGGGQLADLADSELRAPNSQYADRVQELHIKCIHLLLQVVEAELGLSTAED